MTQRRTFQPLTLLRALSLFRALSVFRAVSLILACHCFAVDSGAHDRALQVGDFLLPRWSGGLIANAEFTPPVDAGPARLPFRGTLTLTEIEMTVKPRVLDPQRILGRDVALFPGAKLTFFTEDGDLVPITQDVIRTGSIASGQSYWDIIVQPGRVWSEPGDGDWSRAAFPFALVNSLEGDTHNGIAGFLYKKGEVSNLRFQIIQQTAPYLVSQRFVAAGLVPVRLSTAGIPSILRLEALRRRYQEARAEAVQIADWRKLEAKAGVASVAGFDGHLPGRDIVLAGMDVDGVFYLKECSSAAGPLPWCDRARFGVWSATKALVTETALLRLAQKYGPQVFDLKLVDYVPDAAQHPGWEAVRFEDAIDMATGIGNGSDRHSPNDITDGATADDYAGWYQAKTLQAKLTAMLDTGRVYPWGAAAVARYRDQDMFLLGVAMDRFLKSKEGPSADIWSMLENEVFEPIGIRDAPTSRTIEPEPGRGQPLMAFGYYPTIGDIVRIARLYQSGGKYRERQILYQPRVDELLAGPMPRGLPTGEQLAFGETTYRNAFWMVPYRAGTCEIYYPRMTGYGGDLVALLPRGVTGIRLAKSDSTPNHVESDTAGMARVADKLTHFCTP